MQARTHSQRPGPFPGLARRAIPAAPFILATVLLTHAHAAEPDLLSYEEARTVLYEVSDTRKAGQAAVSRNEDEVRAAKTLGLPDLSANAIEVLGEKTGSLNNTPLGTINFSDNLRGPRSSINTTW